VNIDEQYITNNLILYPNPASNYISINKQPGMEINAIEIINIQGKVVFHQEVTDNNLSYDVSGFPKGLYFIQLNTNKGIEVKKLIVQ
jgi:hypothetical protein